MRVGFQDRTDAIEFALLNGHDILSEAHHALHAWNRENRKSVVPIESAEDVTRKKRKLYFFGAVGPAAGTAIQRQELLKSSSSQVFCNCFFKTRSDVKGIPTSNFFAYLHPTFPF